MATSQLSLLVLTLCILSVSAQLVFVSIDCGSSAQYQDANLIAWSGDDNYTSNGESRTVGSNNSISYVMDSLRVFSNSRNKNCYHIDSVRRGRVLVRASFYYGNYDNRSSPPTFDLQFDGNHWTTVETSISGYLDYEVIYVPKRVSISVCVAQTRPGEFPFISALEVRGLETYMYNFYNGTNPLFLMRRRAYGSNSTIRFGDDHYDRIWNPVLARNTNGYTDVTSDATFGEITTATDRPPPRVLQHAVTAILPNSTIQLSTGFTSIPSRVYLNWYFSEATRLRENETRSFQIFLNDKPISIPLQPPYQNCTQWVAWLYNATSNDTISLVPTNVSTLPPLINGMEVFLIGENDLANGTNRNDVHGLNSLQNAFGVLEDWTGDPCLPAPFSWDWIQCSNDTEPRVTALLLGSFGLSGELPNFGSMNALRTIDLHNNSLSGPIPDFLGSLPSLTQLNLANNRFNGSIPASLSNKTSLNLEVTGNSGLCASGNSSCATSSRNTSGSDKLKSHLLIMVVTSIIPLFIMY